MPTFLYRALDEGGKTRKGFIEAENQARAFNQLQDSGYTPLELHSVSRAGSRFAIPGLAEVSAKLRELAPGQNVRLSESFYYLGMLLQSGTSLAEALDLIGRMAGGRGGQIWLNVRDAVETGESFSQALRAYPRAFPRVYIGMVQVAEGVGRLGPVLERIAQYEEQRKEVSSRLATALVYPLVILLVGLGAVYFLLSRVLPNIAKIFDNAEQTLPWTTQMLLTIGETMQDLGPAVLILPLAVVLGAVAAYQRSARLKLFVDRLLWRAPLTQRHILARFSGMLGFQLEAGIPLVQGLESSAKSVNSSFFQEVIAKAQTEVAAGKPLDKVLKRTGLFPEIYVLTLSSGQKAGQLGPFLQRIGRIFEKDLDNLIKRMMALVEPLLILAIGSVVALIVVAIMGPIFELTTLVR